MSLITKCAMEVEVTCEADVECADVMTGRVGLWMGRKDAVCWNKERGMMELSTDDAVS
ncbi:hypothetical protein FACS189472_09430 [Alphaproteobacteria bacterium]|nr:hypothetical protein FACS189472_09430 [Alphaproteobacteria bacterium]